MLLKNNNKGFSFLEIIIGTIVLLIGISGVMGLVFWGRLVLKHSENKTAAMNVAYSKMEEYLAKSYSRIGTADGATNKDNYNVYTVSSGSEGLIFQESGTTPNSIDWNVNVTQRYEGLNAAPIAGNSIINIPYKQIEVDAYYREENPVEQNTYIRKAVRLVNVVPYPYMHAQEKSLGPNSSAKVSQIYATVGSGNADNLLQLEVDYETPKEVMIMYNIALRIDNGTNLNSSSGVATLFTGCFIDNAAVPLAVETRTPIVTQPLINNVVAYTVNSSNPTRYFKPGKHTIVIKWKKDTSAGVISLRNANLIVIATEKK